jgi:hypothetical protein
MNLQQLKDLAEKAGLSYMPSNYPDMADLYKGADFELEKFAELIIRECAKFTNPDVTPFLFKHFGVEL